MSFSNLQKNYQSNKSNRDTEKPKEIETKVKDRSTSVEFKIQSVKLNLALLNYQQNKGKLGIYKNSTGNTRIVKEFTTTNLGIRSLQFSNNGELIIVGFCSGTIQAFKTQDASLHKTFVEGENLSCSVTCIRFNPLSAFHDIFYTSSVNGKVKTFSLIDEHKNVTIITEKDNEISSIDVNKTGGHMVTAGKDAVIRVYNMERSQLVTEYRSQGSEDIDPEEKSLCYHRQRLFMVKYHPDCSNTFASGGWDNQVKIWDTRTRKGCVNTILGPHISGHSLDIQKQIVLTGSFNMRDGLQLWDLRTGKLIGSGNPEGSTRLFEGKFIYAAQFFKSDGLDEIILAANVSLNALDVISVKQKMVLHVFDTYNPVSAIHSHNNQIGFGDMGKTLYIGEFNET